MQGGAVDLLLASMLPKNFLFFVAEMHLSFLQLIWLNVSCMGYIIIHQVGELIFFPLVLIEACRSSWNVHWGVFLNQQKVHYRRGMYSVYVSA
jgi:hypothetical protein